MSRASTFLGLNKDQLRDIAMGVSRGFQAYNPDNPLASAGAAMEGSLLSGLERERRTEDRQFQLEDEQRRRGQAREDFKFQQEESSKQRREDFSFQLGERREDDKARQQMERDAERVSREEMIQSGINVVPEGPDDFDVAFSQMWGNTVPRVSSDGLVTKRTKSSAKSDNPILSMADASEGMISDEGDIESVMDGVKDGDPVGSESYDLGFAGDGTPVLIFGKDKKSVVPVGKDMWMALMNQRKQMRAEIRDRVMFAGDVAKATESFNKIRAAAPVLQGELGSAIGAMIQIDPKSGMQALQRALGSMETDGGASVEADVKSDLQKRTNATALNWLVAPRGKDIQPNPNGFGEPIEINKKSIRDERIEGLLQQNSREANVEMLAWQRLEDMVPDPALRRMNPRGNFGFIGTQLMVLGQDMVSDMSPLTRLQRLAASGAWPNSVPYQEVPSDPSDAAGKMRYLRYLQSLDGWANSAFGWDATSDGNALAAVVEMRVNEASRQSAISQQRQQEQPQPQKPVARSRPKV